MNANQLVDHFILSCSHDLRAPVSSIKGLVKVAEYFPHHDEIHKCFEKINECTDKMDKLIHSLEEFMVTSHYTPVPTETDCEQFANDILENFQEELVAKNIIVKKEVRVTKPWFIDRYTFSLLLKHLLSNAIAFQDNRKRKKCIAVKISTKKKFTLLEVSDNGMGIPTEFQQKIFQPFYRASTESTGLGMGLFQVSKLVDKNGARLIFKSIENAGSTFLVLIPNHIEL